MSTDASKTHHAGWPTLAQLPVPVKALITCIILTMAIALLGALGQIVVHDIIPTFFAESSTMDAAGMPLEGMQDAGSADPEISGSERGDLFSDDTPAEEEKAHPMPFYKTEQFVWTLKWTHIHLFGMNMIFIFMGLIATFLDVGIRWKTLLVIMPFAGVLIDIATMWLKGYVSPAFFWLHIPGGGLFGFSFFYIAFKGFWEMWGVRKKYAAA